MNINLHLLRLFHTVAELNSFSRAAEALHISQPAVSKGVRHLEEQLDMLLIERGRSPRAGLRLTGPGQVLHEHARGLFALEKAALEDIESHRAALRGHLTIGASTTVAAYWLPSLLAAFQKARPEVGLTLRVGNTQAMEQAVTDCAIDLAVVEGQVTDSRLTATLWRNDPLVVAIPPAEPGLRVIDDVRDRLWLMREPGSGTRAATDQRMHALGLDTVRSLEIDSNEGIARAVAAGLGVAILPHRVIADLLRLGDLDALPLPEHASSSRALYVVRLTARHPSPLTAAFLDILAETSQAIED